jgi:hypothetical protein
MYYEINVAKKVNRAGQPERYEHYFATAPRSITYYRDAVRKVKEFVKLFPAPEYEITINEHPEQFTSYNVEDFLAEWDNEEPIV